MILAEGSEVPIEDRDPRRRESYWTCVIVPTTIEPLSDLLTEWADRLEKHHIFLESLVSSGGRIELFIGWFLDGNDGDIFTSGLLSKLAKLRIDLSLCLYPSEQVGEESSES